MRKNLTLVLAITLLFTALFAFTGCRRPNLADHELVGTWIGSADRTFRGDGTGYMMINSRPTSFTWSVRSGNRLTIRFDQRLENYLRTEQWSYEVENDELILTNRQFADRVDTHVFFDESNLPDLSGHQLVGTWVGGSDRTFHQDGTGYAMISTNLSAFTWFTLSENRLIIRYDQQLGDYIRTELWHYEFSGEGLILTSRQIADRIDWHIFFIDDDTSDHPLLGIWERDNDTSWQYLFLPDGTGNRGMGNASSEFTWRASGNRLLITCPVSLFDSEREFWTFEITEDGLDLFMGDEFAYSYHRPGLRASSLVGVWEWDYDTSWQYLFLPDGTGNRGTSDDSSEFAWTLVEDTLHIICPVALFGVREERWTVTLEGNILTLASQQMGPTFQYRKFEADVTRPQLT